MRRRDRVFRRALDGGLAEIIVQLREITEAANASILVLTRDGVAQRLPR